MQVCRISSLIAMILSLGSQSAAAADFMRGKVVMENGEPPPVRVVIQRVCPGSAPLPEALTTKQGIYMWAVTENLTVPCVLRAVLAGYVSSTIELSLERLYFSPELPAMTFYAAGPGTKPDGSSPLSGAASKSWTLAMKAVTAKNWGEAERLLRITVRAAPNFATAWNSLGAVCQYQQKTVDAGDAYRRAIKLDPDLLTAYLNLIRLEIGSQHWPEASKDAGALVKADTTHRYLEAYLDDAIARFELHDLDGAQGVLNTALPLDKKHEQPRLEYFMGAVLGAKGDREGGAEHLRKYLELAPKGNDAGEVKAYLDNLASAKFAAALPLPAETALLPASVDPSLPVVGDAWVPGGMKALAKMARMKVTPSYENFFLEYCRATAMETLKGNTMRTPGYSANIEAYMAAVAELARLGENRGEKTVITLSLADPGQVQKARQILPLLGWTVVEEDGAARIEPGDQVADGPRQQIPALFDVDEVTMQQALESGKSFQFEIPTENASLTGGVAWWGSVMKEYSTLPGGLAEAFERDPRLAKTYAALAAMQAEAAKAVVTTVGLRALAAQYSDVLWLYSDKFSVSSGAVEVPGGAEAEKVWAKLASANPRDPPAFFRALLVSDRGRVAAFYSALAHADAAHQRFFTKTQARAKRFYTWYRNSDELRDGIGGRHGSGVRTFFRTCRSTIRTMCGFPAEKRSGRRDPVRRGGTSPSQFAGGADRDRAVGRETRGSLRSGFCKARWRRHFNEWHALFPYFEEIPGLGRGELEALEAFSKLWRDTPVPARTWSWASGIRWWR